MLSLEGRCFGEFCFSRICCVHPWCGMPARSELRLDLSSAEGPGPGLAAPKVNCQDFMIATAKQVHPMEPPPTFPHLERVPRLTGSETAVPVRRDRAWCHQATILPEIRVRLVHDGARQEANASASVWLQQEQRPRRGRFVHDGALQEATKRSEVSHHQGQQGHCRGGLVHDGSREGRAQGVPGRHGPECT